MSDNEGSKCPKHVARDKQDEGVHQWDFKTESIASTFKYRLNDM